MHAIASSPFCLMTSQMMWNWFCFYIKWNNVTLTHWGLKKMAAILERTIQNAISQTKCMWVDSNLDVSSKGPMFNEWDLFMMTSSNRNIFHVTGALWEESTGQQWIPFTKASDTELWSSLWSVPQQTVEQTIKTRVIWTHRAHYDVTVIICDFMNFSLLY